MVERPNVDLERSLALQTEDGLAYCWIARDLGISKNTVADIVK